MEPESESENFVFQPVLSFEKTVYLYIQLQAIENFPNLEGRVFIRLTHPTCEIERHLGMDESDIDLSTDINGVLKPSFSISIESDDIDELNNICDNPLSITLYHTITKHQNCVNNMDNEESDNNIEDMSSEEEEIIAVALGYIDLLKFYQRSRPQANVVTYLYPVRKDFGPAENVICKATWYISALNPLLQVAKISNIAFICLESIYNPPSDIMEIYENLEMALIVTSTNENETKRQIICTYKLFKKQIIAQQCVHQKWESMKNPLLNNTESLGTYIGSKININTIFQNLIWEERTTYNAADINIEEDYALICNSVHRFALTTEVHRTVENLIGSDKHALLVELYKSEEPEVVFMQGVLDLSILLYPNVNVGRFSMKLNRVQMVRRSKRRGTQSINKTFSKKRVEDVNKLTFAIIAVSFLTPITELSDEIVEYTESEISKLNLTPSSIIDYDVAPQPTPPDISPNVLYRTLDSFISSFTECIVRQKKPDCGFVVETLNDIITAIVYAHSKRNVPEDYIELNELLAVTYNDLEFRINERVKKFLETDLLSKLSYKSNETMVFELMNCMKYMYEAGNEQFGDQLYNKLQNEQSNNLYYQFYMFLYNLEKKKYSEAQTYLSKPQEQRLFGTEYFEDLIQIYINYIESLQKIKINQAIGELIKELRNFANKNYEDITVWILLYCLYHKSYYKPGISYARWKFMCLYDSTSTELPEIPISLWQIYNNYELTLKSKRGKNFYRTMKFLLQLGLYKFGELIFFHLADQLPAIEDYITMITFKIIFGESTSKFKIKNFDGYRSNTPRLALILEQLNGCLEDCRGDSGAAQNYYQLILRNEDKSLSYVDVQLSLLRYAFAAYAKASFESAIDSLKLFIITDENNVIINLFIGKAFYKMKQFEEAFEYLRKSTFQGIHIPEIWVLLALVNLQLGNNYSAIECWKYANIKPNTQFSEEIYEELENIDVRKVSLQVKRPNSHMPCVKTKFKKLKRNKDF